MCLWRIVYCPTSDSVLPNKQWCTPQQEIVYSPASFGVLSNKFWCTPQQVGGEILPAKACFGSRAKWVSCIVNVIVVIV